MERGSHTPTQCVASDGTWNSGGSTFWGLSLSQRWGEGCCRGHMTGGGTGDGNGENMQIMVTFQLCVYVRA